MILLGAFLGTLFVQTLPAHAFQEQWLFTTSEQRADGFTRTVPGVWFQISQSALQARNFEARLEAYNKNPNYGASVLAFAVVNCYAGSYASGKWYTGSGGGTNWTPFGSTARQNVSIRVHHLFSVPAGDPNTKFTCRLGVRFNVTPEAVAAHGVPTMVIVGGQTRTWLHLGDVTYSFPTSQTSSHPSDSYIGWRATTSEPTTATILTREHYASPSGAGRTVYAQADAYFTTCYSSGDCGLAHAPKPGSNPKNGSALNTYFVVTRLTSGGSPCGQTNATYGITADNLNPTANHTIGYYVHHLKIDHAIYVSNAPNGSCSNRFKIELHLRWTSGNAIRIEGGTTGQREWCPALNTTCPTRAYAQTILNAISR